MTQRKYITAPKVNAMTPQGVIDRPFTCGALYLNIMRSKELWKDVPGFEGIYSVSSFGRLKSFKRGGRGYILKNTNRAGGYFSLVLEYKNNVAYCRMHNLMALVFLGIKTSKKLHVHHIDGNKQNNHLWNLEVLSAKSHVLISIKDNPKIIRGMNFYNTNIKTIPIIQLSIDGVKIAEYKNGADALRATGVCHRNIMQVASKTEYKPGLIRHQAGGFVWKLKELLCN